MLIKVLLTASDYYITTTQPYREMKGFLFLSLDPLCIHIQVLLKEIQSETETTSRVGEPVEAVKLWRLVVLCEHKPTEEISQTRIRQKVQNVEFLLHNLVIIILTLII